jgi:hypothetical protein
VCWPRQHWVLSNLALSQTLLISGGRLLDAFPCEVVLLELRRLTGRAPFPQLAIGVDHTWVSVHFTSPVDTTASVLHPPSFPPRGPAGAQEYPISLLASCTAPDQIRLPSPLSSSPFPLRPALDPGRSSLSFLRSCGRVNFTSANHPPSREGKGHRLDNTDDTTPGDERGTHLDTWGAQIIQPPSYFDRRRGLEELCPGLVVPLDSHSQPPTANSDSDITISTQQPSATLFLRWSTPCRSSLSLDAAIPAHIEHHIRTI